MTRLMLACATAALIACAHADSAALPADRRPAARQPADQAPAVQKPAKPTQPLSSADTQALAEFNDRVKQYLAVHNRLEATLPDLPKEADPKAIDAHQRALEKLLRAERKYKDPGNIFTPEVQAYIRRVLAQVLAGKEGANLKGVIMDENPGKISLTVNSRYPDSVPLSTVPPQVLAALPKLPEDLEYRFIGDRLILLDVHAHTIADYMDNVFP